MEQKELKAKKFLSATTARFRYKSFNYNVETRATRQKSASASFAIYINIKYLRFVKRKLLMCSRLCIYVYCVLCHMRRACIPKSKQSSYLRRAQTMILVTRENIDKSQFAHVMCIVITTKRCSLFLHFDA